MTQADATHRDIVLADEYATLGFGARLAARLESGDIVFLIGPLGAGKTTLARGVIAALAPHAGEVPSPTYTLVQVYETDAFAVWHCDLFRLESADESRELGLEDAYAEAVVLIEWPDRLGETVPADRLEVALSAAGDGRAARLTGFGTWRERVHEL